MRRTIELEVDEGGGLVWNEGGIVEIPPSLSAAYEGHPFGTLLEAEGDYFRPDRRTRILRVTATPKVVPLRYRALCVWTNPERLAPHVPALERDPSGDAAALVACHAASAGRLDDTRAALLRALEAGPTIDVAAPLAAAWQSLANANALPSLSPPLRRQLLDLVWNDSAMTLADGFSFWIHPTVYGAHKSLSRAERCPLPWHFGGARVEPEPAIVIPWLERELLSLCGGEEEAEVSRLRKLPREALKKWIHESEARDERTYRAAYAGMLARLPPDWEGSPPDDVDVGDSLERDQVPATWARLRLGGLAESGASVARLYSRRVAPLRGMAFAADLDALVILAAVQPALVGEYERAVFASPNKEDGFVVASLKSGQFALLRAPAGAFGKWTIAVAPRSDMVASLPMACRARAQTALDGSYCQFIEPGVIRR